MAYNLNEQYRRYLRNEMSETELQDFLAEATRLENEETVKEWMDGEWVEIAGLAASPPAFATDSAKAMSAKKATADKPKVLKIWRRVAVAAVFIGVLFLGYLLLVDRKATIHGPQTPVAVTKDVEAPKTANAVITLANGEQIILDSAGNGTLATQGNVNLVKLADGQIVYSSESGVRSREIQYNTLTNPRGSKVVNLTLSDGSKVWLNAESSLRYPIVFVGSERKVEITGEAYFEVRPHPQPFSTSGEGRKTPFIVKKGDVEVEVLGTQFNVNTYEDEEAIRVTLLEGSVAISRESGVGSRNKLIIKPGQQAQVTNDIKVVSNIDVDEVMAWKNGRFHFNKADLQTVLRQLARWYDVYVEYEGKIPVREFEGKIQRDLNLAEVLKILEKNNVNFSIEGKKIIVKP